MEKGNIYEALHPDRLKTYIEKTFSEAGINSKELLLDDNKIEKAAHKAYKKIPLIPFRATIKAIIGRKGFVNFVFRIRDKMVETESMDLSWLNMDYIKSTLLKIKT
jgi:hypothetical protein